MPIWVAILVFIASGLESTSRGITWAVKYGKTDKDLVRRGLAFLMLGIFVELIAVTFPQLSDAKDLLEGIFGAGFGGLGVGYLLAAANVSVTKPGDPILLMWPAPSETLASTLVEFWRAIRSKPDTPEK